MEIREGLLCPEAWNIIEKDESPSTNSELKAFAEAGAPEGTVIIARRQTAGRGRLGRSFYSPPETGLYLSVLLRPDAPAEEAVRITVVAAVAAARAAKQACNAETQIKWVNDLYRDGSKVCGILTEGATDPGTGRLHYAVCGAGFNIAPPPEGFPPELEKIAGSLCDKYDPAFRPRLAAAFLNELRRGLTEPPLEIMEEYRRRSCLIGKQVVSPAEAFPGPAKVLGIDDRAGLILRLPDGTQQILTSGEVSVRLHE